MNSPAETNATQNGFDLEFARVFEKITARLVAHPGESVESLIGEYPERAEELRGLLPLIEVMAEMGRSEGSPAATAVSEQPLKGGILGDFRLRREIGRGGMGVVYEAEQVSLGRTVALKVLPFAAMLDPRQLNRFQNEARAAASLHHTNIVPVHFVGCERSVHFYAMQYIEGESLARVISRLRRQNRHPEPTDDPDPSTNERRLADLSRSLTSDQFISGRTSPVRHRRSIGNRRIAGRLRRMAQPPIHQT